MQIWLVLDLCTDEPRNIGVSVHKTEQEAASMAAKLEREEQDTDGYIVTVETVNVPWVT